MMPLGALLTAFYTLLVWKFDKFQEETNVGAEKLKVYNWWAPLVKFIVPVALVIIFITGLMQGY